MLLSKSGNKRDTIISFKAQIHTRKRMNAKYFKILKYENKKV